MPLEFLAVFSLSDQLGAFTIPLAILAGALIVALSGRRR